MAVNRVAASPLSRPFDLSRSATESAGGSGKSVVFAHEKEQFVNETLPRHASGSRCRRSRGGAPAPRSTFQRDCR